MPWKTWAYMERVTSPDFQSYLQDQTVAQFVSTAQRDAQWATPPKGAMCVTTDSNTMWTYDGTAWRSRTSPRGIIVSGPQVATPAINTVLGLNTVINGAASWLAANTITIPVGAGGLYDVRAAIAVQNGNGVGVPMMNLRDNTATILAGMELAMLSGTWSGVFWYHGAWVRQFPDNQTIRAYYGTTGGPTYVQVARLSVVRIGDALATY